MCSLLPNERFRHWLLVEAPVVRTGLRLTDSDDTTAY